MWKIRHYKQTDFWNMSVGIIYKWFKQALMILKLYVAKMSGGRSSVRDINQPRVREIFQSRQHRRKLRIKTHQHKFKIVKMFNFYSNYNL